MLSGFSSRLTIFAHRIWLNFHFIKYVVSREYIVYHLILKASQSIFCSYIERQLVRESWISMHVNEVKFYVWRDESIIGEHNSGFLSGDICN